MNFYVKTFWLFLLLLLCQVAAILAPIRAIWALLTGNHYRAFEIMKGYDLLGNSVLNGEAGEYISTRANRARSEKRRWGCYLCTILDSIDDNHCAKSPPKIGSKPIVK